MISGQLIIMFDNNQKTKIKNDRFWSYLATVSIHPGAKNVLRDILLHAF